LAQKKSRPIGTRRDGRRRVQVEEQFVDMPSPHPSSFQLVQTYFEPNFYLYKYPSNLNPVILLVYTTYEGGIDSVLKHWHIKFTCQGIRQKKKYNTII
jgi:hypothetical protein